MASVEQYFDLATLSELQQIMEDDFCVLVDTFVRDSRQRLQHLRDALSRGDADTVCIVAHSFKGSAGSMSAGRLADCCRQLESMGRDKDLTRAAPVLEVLATELEGAIQALESLPSV